MPRRYYRSNEDRALYDAAGCSIALLIAGLFALGHAVRPRPLPYAPQSPFETEQSNSTHRNYGPIPFNIFLAILCGVLAILAFSQYPTLTRFAADADKARQLIIGGIGLSIVGVFFAFRAYQLSRQLKLTDDLSENPVIFDTSKSRVYNIFPQKTDADAIASSKLMQSLLATSSHLVFQIVGSSQGTKWQILDPKGTISPQTMLDNIRSHIEGATVLFDGEGAVTPSTTRYPFYRKIIFFGLANDYAAPVFALEFLKAYDPLMAIVNRMSFVQPKHDERIVYTLVTLIPSAEAKRIAGERIKEGMVRPLSGLVQDQKGNEIILDQQVLDEKLTATLYHTFLAITLESRDEQRINELSAIANDVSHFTTPGYNVVRTALSFPVAKFTSQQENLEHTVLTIIETWSSPTSEDIAWEDALLVLSPAELTSLWHLPNELFTAPAIMWAGLGVPEELTKSGTTRIVIGDVNEFGRTVTVSLPLEDRSTHQYIAGKTNMGKSTLLHNLIHQDIQLGLGTVVIDPHGKLVDDILAHSIPQARLNDVVLLDCGNTEYPIPLNPFRRPPGIAYQSAFNLVYWTLQKIYESIWLVGRTDMAFRNVLSALLLDPEATPLDIQRVFHEPAYRDYLIALLAKHEYGSMSAVQYWQSFNRMSLGQQAVIYEPILSRTGALLGTRHLENMTCHPHTLNLRQFIEQKKIVLINLSGEAIKSEVGNLGAIFLSGLFMASEAMSYISGDTPRVTVYVDEAERILSTPLPDMFAQARKFGLSLTLANQYLDQLDGATTQGILGNVGTKFIFEVGNKDATLLAKYTEPEIPSEKLMNLGSYHVAVKTRVGGTSLPAIIARTRSIPDMGAGLIEISSLRRRMPSTLQLMNQTSVREFITRRYVEMGNTQAPQSSQPTDQPAAKSGDGLEDFE